MTETKQLLARLCTCVSLSLGCLADEAAQVTFALRLANNASSVSLLLSAGLVGALLAGPLAPKILQRMGPLRLISSVFAIQSLLIAGTSWADQLIAYLVVAVALGCTGSLLWSAAMVAIPGFAHSEHDIDRTNRIIQTVRYLGCTGGPALGGMLYALADGSRGMCLLALLVLLSALVTAVCFKILPQHNHHTVITAPDNSQNGLDFIGLLHTKGVIRAVAPLIITVMLTSALNVLLIIRLRNGLNLSAESYGLVISMMSIGLILGSLILSAPFSRLGDAAGASVAAAVIGLGIFCLAHTTLLWNLMATTFVIGVANGVQNTLMSSFMMKAINKERRIFQMPGYILMIQTAVFIGFASAGFIKIQQISIALGFIGMITIIVGLCGFAVNINNQPNRCTKGTK